MKITLLGNGSWATALAFVLKETLEKELEAKTYEIFMWGALREEIESIKREGENKKYLPGRRLTGITLTSSLSSALRGSDLAVVAVPTKYLFGVIEKIINALESKTLVLSVAKGFYQAPTKNGGGLERFSTVSELFAQQLGKAQAVAALSGPSHAEEVFQKKPTMVTVAAERLETVALVQRLFSTPYFKIYYHTDLVGVELGGAVKNIIAIAAGICYEKRYGQNALSALITRGLRELVRFGKHYGAEEATFYGLSGVGDLITTCTSSYSRNHYVGRQVAAGKKWAEVEAEMTMVAEGVTTVKTVNAYRKLHGLYMPITKAVHGILFEGLALEKAMRQLMSVDLKKEFL